MKNFHFLPSEKREGCEVTNEIMEGSHWSGLPCRGKAQGYLRAVGTPTGRVTAKVLLVFILVSGGFLGWAGQSQAGSLSVSILGDGQLSANLGVAWGATGNLPPADFTDATGSGAGWNATITSTDFSGGRGSDVIPATDLFYTAVSVSVISPTVNSGTGAVPVDAGNEALPLNNPVKFLTAVAGTGEGSYSSTEAGSLSLSRETYAGSYSSTVTITVSTTP